MAPDESVSHWLSLLQSGGDAAAAQRLWERYFRRLVGLARPGDSSPAGLDQFAGREPTPEFAAEVAEECRLRLGRLDNAELQAIAVWKMEGDTAPEIAARLGCALSTVERRLRLIRQIWESEEAP